MPRAIHLAQGPLEHAYPARRFVQLAKGLGPSAALFSVCRSDYRDALSFVVERAALLTE